MALLPFSPSRSVQSKLSPVGFISVLEPVRALSSPSKALSLTPVSPLMTVSWKRVTAALTLSLTLRVTSSDLRADVGEQSVDFEGAAEDGERGGAFLGGGGARGVFRVDGAEFGGGLGFLPAVGVVERRARLLPG